MRASSLPILWFTAAAVFVGGVGGVGCGSSPTPGGTGGRGGNGDTSSVTSAVSSTSTGAGGAGGSTATSGSGGSGGATASATGTGGAGGGTSGSAASGTGGAGGATSLCMMPSDCPPPAGECVTATCVAGACGTSNAPAGTATMMQTPGDCLKNTCDGNGAITATNDDTDVKDDSNPCTTDGCGGGGVPTHLPVAAGAACGVGQVCNAAGSCVGCVTAASCPGVDDECKTRSCTANVCGFSFTAAGTPTAAQTAKDCKKNQCDGAGAIVPVADGTDLPVDNLQCTNDVCTAGAPSNPPTQSGSACNQNGGTTCNGGGQCLQCLTASTCPGMDTQCQTRTCMAGACGFSFAASGTPTSAQTAGDCKQNECNGAGAIVANSNNADVPNDNNLCTSDACTGGVPSNLPVAAGSSCGAGLVCNAMGTCLGCNTATDCPGTDTECQTRTCSNNTCGFAFTAAGTPTSAQTAGDCKQNECNGAGAIVANIHNADLPSDASQCTSDVCTAGVPSNPNLAAGTACAQNGGTTCDGAGACTLAGGSTTDFVVLRLGDGITALSSAAAPGILEHRLIDGSSVGTIALPIVASGANKPLTFAGTSTSEGGVSRSGDGHYVTMGGYAAVPGTAAVASTTSMVNNRVAGRVDANNVVDTSTLFTAAFSSGNIRSVTSNDGTSFWASGSVGAVEYIPFGTTTATQINTTPINLHFLHVFSGQLYGTSGAGMFTNVFTVGTGLPTTAGQTVTSFPGMPTATANPYSFVILDRNAAVPGLDTTYVADDRAAASGGGIQKWTFDGTTWTLIKTLTSGATGFRGLAGVVTGANVTLVATTTTATANSVVVFVDDGSAAPAGTVIATAQALTVYRGIAFAPK